MNTLLEHIACKSETSNIYREPYEEKEDYIGALEIDIRYQINLKNRKIKKDHEQKNNTNKFYYNPRWHYSDFCAQA